MAHGTLTPAQVERLLRPIKPHRVLQAQGQSHIPAYDVVAHLNRMFGFGGWDKKIVSIELVEQRENKYTKDGKEKTGWYVTYRCHMRLIVKDQHGDVVTIKEDGACGSASNLPSLGDAHDFAYKNAISYALKRCAKDLGDQFGLSLYNKGATGALVGTTLIGLTAAEDADLEDFAPTPRSLGNDERHVDPETGEILSDEATAVGASEVTGASPERKGGTEPPTKTPAGEKTQTSVPAGGVVGQRPPATSTPDEERRRKRVNAAMSKAGIRGDAARHALIRFATDGKAESSNGLDGNQEHLVVRAADKVAAGSVVERVQLDGTVEFVAAELVE